jgi:hypothetical protein
MPIRRSAAADPVSTPKLSAAPVNGAAEPKNGPIANSLYRAGVFEPFWLVLPFRHRMG